MLTSKIFLAIVVVLGLSLAVTRADSCQYHQGYIACCRNVLDRKVRGGLVFYRCRYETQALIL
jgi:hypothetical protein